MGPRDILESLLDAWQAQDALRASACFTQDGTYTEAGGREVIGRSGIAAHFARFFKDGPPWRFIVEEVILQGERAAVAYRFAVKGEGAAWHERTGCALVAFEGGAVKRWREYDG